MLLYFIKIGSERYMCMENTVGQTQVNAQAQNPQTVQVPNYSGVNIQVFNPSVAAPGAVVPPSTVNNNNYITNPAYPSNYYTQNFAQPIMMQPGVQPVQPATKKTEKRDIVVLNDDYIKSLEGFLNDQDKQARLMGAKEVIQRLQEDNSRKDDPALNALVNKMLQDPSQSIRLLAMSALDSRLASGDGTSVKILRGMQQRESKNDFQKTDGLSASKVLMKMSTDVVSKEFEAKDNKNNGGS